LIGVQPDYNGWLFEPWAVQLTDLPYAIPRILQEWDLITQFSIDESTLLRFSHVVRHRYTDRNAFHNFYHAISVMQTVHVMLLDCGLKSSLDGIAVFGVLIAALCHDLDHPGVNNALLAGCGSDLACLYNDVSILENHHTAVAWEVGAWLHRVCLVSSAVSVACVSCSPPDPTHT
jgi:3'5'-cyclic nucleotide phosphodiesterase